MSRYAVFVLATGYAVARISPQGGALVLTECATEEGAQRECRRLELEQQQSRQRATVRGMVRAELGRRATSARYFEPDAFA